MKYFTLIIWILVVIITGGVFFYSTYSGIKCHEKGGVFVNDLFNHACIKAEIVE